MLYPQTERQQHFIAIAKTLAEQFAQTSIEHDRAGTFPLENYDAIRTAGLPALIIPEEYGGWGATLLDTVMTMEALAIGDGSTSLSLTMHMQTLGNTAENFRLGNPTWPEALFARICHEAVEKGALINSIATEPELGSPSRGGKPRTTATPIDMVNGAPSAYLLNGHKTFASMIPALDYMIVAATLQDGTERVARFVASTEIGVEIQHTWDALGMRSTGSHDVTLTDLYVPAEYLLGVSDSAKPTKGGKVNPWFMLVISSVYVGVALAAQKEAVRFARERVPTGLGKPIAETESIQRRLGEVELLLRQARVLIYQAADMWVRFPDRHLAMTASVATAKYTATNNAIAAVEQCMRVVGGLSMTRKLPLEKFYRDVRGGIYHPMNDDVALTTLGKLSVAANGLRTD